MARTTCGARVRVGVVERRLWKKNWLLIELKKEAGVREEHPAPGHEHIGRVASADRQTAENQFPPTLPGVVDASRQEIERGHSHGVIRVRAALVVPFFEAG